MAEARTRIKTNTQIISVNSRQMSIGRVITTAVIISGVKTRNTFEIIESTSNDDTWKNSPLENLVIMPIINHANLPKQEAQKHPSPKIIAHIRSISQTPHPKMTRLSAFGVLFNRPNANISVIAGTADRMVCFTHAFVIAFGNAFYHNIMPVLDRTCSRQRPVPVLSPRFTRQSACILT